MPNFPRLKNQLEESYKKYKDSDFLVGRLNDKLLQNLLQEILANQALEQFVIFVSCINYFYSTRIQVAKGNRDLNIVKIAKIIKRNWDRGLMLSTIDQGDKIDSNQVQKLRKEIFNELDTDLVSLTTKIFHQLNSQYPIYDTRVCEFLKKKAKIGRVNIKDDYNIFCTHYFEVLNKIQWHPNKINEFDNAVWILMPPKKKKSSGK